MFVLSTAVKNFQKFLNKSTLLLILGSGSQCSPFTSGSPITPVLWDSMKDPATALSAGLDGKDHMCVNKPQIFGSLSWFLIFEKGLSSVGWVQSSYLSLPTMGSQAHRPRLAGTLTWRAAFFVYVNIHKLQTTNSQHLIWEVSLL